MAGTRIVEVPAESGAWRHCECGCGYALQGRDHVAVITPARLAWHAWDADHAGRIIRRLAAHPFEVCGELVGR